MDFPSRFAAYADLFQRSSDSTLLLDPNSRTILEANLACENVLGISIDQLRGKLAESWVESDCQAAFCKSLRMALRRYNPYQFNTRFRHSDGRTIHMEIKACPLRLANGSEVLQVIAHDVTFKREAEAKLQALVKELQDANVKLQELSTHDEMTGLFNFRHFKHELQKEHVRSSRFGQPYSIVFCDIDHFKKYNDRNNHLAGDRLLKEFAVTLQKSCRNSDLVARYGGEEFVIICPGVDAFGAAILAERIRVAVNSTNYPFGEHQPMGRLTVSIGVADFPANGRTPEDVLQAADKAVYQSKAQGRNQVTLSSIQAEKPGNPAAA